jgi:Tol biopolymer transport system component
VAFDEDDPKTGRDVWLLDMELRQVRPFLRTSSDEAWARFSPDGEWLAYHSNESGAFEVYASPMQDPSRRCQVSTGGGTEPIWSPAGDQIYYSRADQVVAVSIRINATTPPALGRPQVLFAASELGVNDVGPGGRLLAVDAPSSISINRLHLVLGWQQVVARLAQGR